MTTVVKNRIKPRFSAIKISEASVIIIDALEKLTKKERAVVQNIISEAYYD